MRKTPCIRAKSLHPTCNTTFLPMIGGQKNNVLKFWGFRYFHKFSKSINMCSIIHSEIGKFCSNFELKKINKPTLCLITHIHNHFAIKQYLILSFRLNSFLIFCPIYLFLWFFVLPPQLNRFVGHISLPFPSALFLFSFIRFDLITSHCTSNVG